MTVMAVAMRRPSAVQRVLPVERRLIMATLRQRSLVASYPAEHGGVLRRLAKRALRRLAQGPLRTLARQVLRWLTEHNLLERSPVYGCRAGTVPVERMVIKPALTMAVAMVTAPERIQKGRRWGAAAEDVVELSAGCIGWRPVRVIGPEIRGTSFAQW